MSGGPLRRQLLIDMFPLVDKRQLVETALRILVGWNRGRNPAEVDVEQLRLAFPSFGICPADELACRVVKELSAAAFPSAIPRTPPRVA